MLAKRVILCLTFSDGVLMRTKKFVPDYRYTQSFSWAGDADELVLVDVTPQPWPDWPGFLADYVFKQQVDIPVTVNCRIPTTEYGRNLLNSGADKLLVSWKRKDIYAQISQAFGAQALTAGIDYTSEGLVREGVVGPDCAAQQAASLGAGEILLTSIDRDGSLAGYDLPILSRAAGCVSVPVVVAGGCGSWSHIKAAFEAGAQGAVTSNIFHLNPTAMRACKTWLTQNYSGPVRPADSACS